MKDRKLTTSETQLIQRTFEMLIPLDDTFAVIFYDRFFEIAPQVRPLFRTPMSAQREKLMSMLSHIVRGMNLPEIFIPELKQMGMRHAAYGVEPAHYPLMQEAAMWTLSECLGDKATDEMCAAWEKALIFVSDVMLAGAEQLPDPD